LLDYQIRPCDFTDNRLLRARAAGGNVSRLYDKLRFPGRPKLGGGRGKRRGKSRGQQAAVNYTLNDRKSELSASSWREIIVSVYEPLRVACIGNSRINSRASAISTIILRLFVIVVVVVVFIIIIIIILRGRPIRRLND